MKKKLFISILVFIILAVSIITGYFIFSKKKTTVINNQSALSDDIDDIDKISQEINPSSESVADTQEENKNSEESSDNATEKNNAPDATKVDVSTTDDKEKKDENVSASFSVNNKLVSWGYAKSSGRKIDTIIIHTSYDAIGSDPFSFSGVLAEYKGIGVSPHYIIDRAGKVYRLVADANIAYHAGTAKTPDGRTNVNEFSIGIEVINTKTDKPTSAQYSALKNLIASLKGKYKIKYVLGHSQVAPGRKDDPWNFDWAKIK
jgi:hypothetical protein